MASFVASMGNKGQPVVKKAKKKQVKDELDRQKQAEKKKRRLEKALATSAAIISELEKKKQMKKEEQQRLDEEGAAIAEAVALHVLIGEDSDDSYKILLKNDGLNPWECPGQFDHVMNVTRPGIPVQEFGRCSLEGSRWTSNLNRFGSKWHGFRNDYWSVSAGPYAEGHHHALCFEQVDGAVSEISAGIIAAQSVSSLQIAVDRDEEIDILDRMQRGM
ncbi:uncharacterized protein LOC111482632 [Cucurbita maxima]|uniref:Uncharacterized protein LOC111482632 n=1 Tax=Cucurbita maxima TaxID=3661 RepID=A0A6J1JA12_CUCMA|nr:uncharacterized protein LOC111482632 [Cucurbita maxima]XP_022984280.1 uncharacterized protein LOC111482632 [Cucurbita maxima]XP_022984281.1 uncharacterized protein LOC111482632 [Cucurbita maxima]XP_022984282.1 uncharacterized protein LOC111482632 [Cucurbita maxima]